jgi:hypothetical protein
MTWKVQITRRFPALTYKQSGRISPHLLVLLSVFLLIAALLVGWYEILRFNSMRARRTWKTSTLQKLGHTRIENEDIRTEIDQIKNPTPNLNFGWAHDHVILMTNGEYLVYEFWHGFNSGTVDHLFLAHGTDGKWYYSTYHFCSHMAGILGDDPAGSISEFAKRYSVREFDGKSDECLKHTWP